MIVVLYILADSITYVIPCTIEKYTIIIDKWLLFVCMQSILKAKKISLIHTAKSLKIGIECVEIEEIQH